MSSEQKACWRSRSKQGKRCDKGTFRPQKNGFYQYPDQEILPKSPVGASIITGDLKIDLKELNKTVEDLVIQSMLEQNMTKTDVAKALGISKQALFKKMNN